MTPDLKDRLDKTIAGDKVVIFMKGTKNMPQCGFSAQVVKVMDLLDQDFTDINVLEDFEVREGIKEYSEWPTIPQVYVDGEFIGGCDITVEMFQSGELKELLSKNA